jgi:hypothetical protein
MKNISDWSVISVSPADLSVLVLLIIESSLFSLRSPVGPSFLSRLQLTECSILSSIIDAMAVIIDSSR